MLANKSILKLEHAELKGLMEIPEIGGEPEKIEVTCLGDSVKQYENGIGDAGEMAFTFKYDNSSSDTAYRKLRALQEGDRAGKFTLVFADGTEFGFTAKVNIKISGGGVNSAITFTCSMILQSDITITDPEA